MFKRTIDRGNLLVADATAREMRQISREEALELLAPLRQVPGAGEEDRVCARPVAEKKRLPLAPTSTAAGVARHPRVPSPGCRSGAEPVWFLGGAVRPAPVAHKKGSALFPVRRRRGVVSVVRWT
jgi:hypothetical protein